MKPLSSFLSYIFLVLNMFIIENTKIDAFTIPTTSTTIRTTTSTNTCTKIKYSKLISTFEADDFSSPTWPYTEQDMIRLDSSNDSNFYDTPRFVTHIDDRAIESLTTYYREEMESYLQQSRRNKLDVLDLCSSWISHYPTDMSDYYQTVIGIGMNEEELKANPQLTSYFTQDLNQNPYLTQFQNDSFDIITNVVSVDYLTHPLEIFQEMHRILRPGGIALISFSNRCFPSKAVNMWLKEDDIGRLAIVGSYFHYSSSAWSSIEAYDIKLAKLETPPRPSVAEIMKDPSKAFAWANTASAVAKLNGGDPMFVVKGIKK